MEGGSTIEDSVLAAVEFEKAGIDLLDISGGFCGYRRPGGIVDANAAKQLLESHKADLIGVGRAILKDSNWAKEAIMASKKRHFSF